MLNSLRPVKGRKGKGHNQAAVTEAGGKICMAGWWAAANAEVTWAASLLVHPAVYSSCPAAPVLLEQFFPALTKNEKAGRSLPRPFGQTASGRAQQSEQGLAPDGRCMSSG